jgi:hypothetical protein
VYVVMIVGGASVGVLFRGGVDVCLAPCSLLVLLLMSN